MRPQPEFGKYIRLPFEHEYHTAAVDSEEILNLATVSSKRPAPSETPFTERWLGNSCVSPLEAQIDHCAGLDGCQRNVPPSFVSFALVRWSKTCVMAYTVTVSSFAPPWLMASLRSDFASVISPCNNSTAPRAVSSHIEGRGGFANRSVSKELESECPSTVTGSIVDSISWGRRLLIILCPSF